MEYVAGWPAVVAACLGATGAIVAQWLGKHMDRRRQRDHEAAESQVAQREEVRQGYLGIINSLQADQKNLWTMFREMQVALEKCERMHRDDAGKIEALQAENRDQARRIKDLERLTSNGNEQM